MPSFLVFTMKPPVQGSPQSLENYQGRVWHYGHFKGFKPHPVPQQIIFLCEGPGEYTPVPDIVLKDLYQVASYKFKSSYM